MDIDREAHLFLLNNSNCAQIHHLRNPLLIQYSQSAREKKIKSHFSHKGTKIIHQAWCIGSLCVSLSLPPCCWFHGKEVSLFILDNYLSGNPLKQFAVALFCGKRNNLSGVYLTRQRDKKATREWAIHSAPSHSLELLYSDRVFLMGVWILTRTWLEE